MNTWTRALVCCLQLLVLFNLVSCASTSNRIEQSAEALSNDDVKWQGMIAGLQPILVNPRAAALVKSRASQVDNRLLKMLADKGRFIIAHVLLSLRNREERNTHGAQWDGLHVELLADGTTQIDPSQRWALKQMWEKRLGKTSR